MTTSRHPYPDESNGYLAELARLMRGCFHRLTGRDLVAAGLNDLAAARAMFHAPFALLCHDTSPDPAFIYGNLTAMRLFELDWDGLIGMPSRLSAEAPDRAERERLLATVSAQGYIDDYAGVRRSCTGQHFRIERATVWNVVDDEDRLVGQAATFSRWHYPEAGST